MKNKKLHHSKTIEEDIKIYEDETIYNDDPLTVSFAAADPVDLAKKKR